MEAVEQAEPVVQGAKYLRMSAEASAERDRNRRVKTHIENARRAIAQLERVTNAHADTKLVLRTGSDEQEHADRERRRQEATELLEALRRTCETLEVGPPLDMVRTLKAVAPALLARLRALVPAALRRATDLRAAASFAAGARDHIEMGLEAVPQPSRRRGPAVRARDVLG